MVLVTRRAIGVWVCVIGESGTRGVVSRSMRTSTLGRSARDVEIHLQMCIIPCNPEYTSH
jgi:hypothetical protein